MAYIVASLRVPLGLSASEEVSPTVLWSVSLDEELGLPLDPNRRMSWNEF